MKARWYISTFIISLTLLGTVCQQQTSVPNQEIVLQFTDVLVTSDEAKQTITTIKRHLQTLGADNVQVEEELKEGKLIITYYSDADVVSIKNTLSKDIHLKLDYSSFNRDKENSSFPLDDKSISYNLDVFEIQNGNDADLDLEGKNALELKPSNDFFFNPNDLVPNDGVDIREDNKIVKLTYRVLRDFKVDSDNTLHNILEVRAGPVFTGVQR